MGEIKIITDSGADLPKNLVEQYNIDVIPLLVYLGEQEYLDGETIQPVEIFNGMREGKVYKTAQVPASVFREKFTEYAERKENCIYIAFSSELSGTCRTAQMVKSEILNDYPDFELEIIDSKCASLGFGMVVLKAAKMAKEGASKSDILHAVQFYSQHMEHIFTVDNLEYLYRGGRVSRASAFIGSLLNIKPVLNVEDGKLIPIDKVRSRKKAISRMVEIMKERGADLPNQIIGISHGDDPEGVHALRQMIEESFGCREFLINTIGSAIGAHSGPGTLALFFLNEKAPL